ncbi:PQ loop repeat-domain-containing protein [Glomus cerebriforme]|uniref:PQ loop repeat-domain-containing protein n=1 Tax=Glomus cerebriforme TaxID=658196 RepID=A0A397SGL8_9GLOM|nr:PQ loop repeat-domain-containing protein [Glomus cerebriforme]
MDPINIASFGVILSKTIGWLYFFAWSISFYPQTILNWRRKSVQGLSIDFLWFNVCGFACYTVFNLAFFSSEEIRKEYRDRNNGKDNLVQVNDVAFALHALTLSTITLIQTFIYKNDQRISSAASLLISILLLFAFSLLIGVSFGLCQWIDFLYFLSYIKLCFSFIKYVPQAYLNFKRKSTVGWSIHNILLDFTGGILSIFQLVLDAYLQDNWNGILGYYIKFGLGFVSLSFDLLFITQHYILYRNRVDPDLLLDDESLEGTRLLPPKSNRPLNSYV